VTMIEGALKSRRNPLALIERLSNASAMKTDPAGPAPLAGVEPWGGDKGPRTTLEDEFWSLHLQLARTRATKPENHPDVQALERHRDRLRTLLLPEPAATDGSMANARDAATLKIELLSHELDDLQVLEKSLTKLFTEEQRGLSDAHLQEIQDDMHRK